MMRLLYRLLSHREWLQIKGWLEECLNFSSEQICIPYTTNNFPSIQIRAMGDETEWMHRTPIYGGPRQQSKRETNLICSLALKFNFLRRPISPGLLLFFTWTLICTSVTIFGLHAYIYIYIIFMLSFALHSDEQYWLELERRCCVSSDNACVSAGEMLVFQRNMPMH
jgi:hypothetical protein